jgi:hypothetical protein
VIPTIWANVCPIHIGVDPDGDPSADPTTPIWQEILNYFAGLAEKPSVRVSEITLLASAWAGTDGFYSQVVAIDGITKNSQVDLKPSAEQLVIFRQKDIAFSTENDDGIVTVFVVGDKPANDYTMQVSITEVIV